MDKGLGVSDGIAMGKAIVIESENIKIEKKIVEDSSGEIKNYYEALEITRKELNKYKKQAEENMGFEEAQIFDAHIMFLDDPEIKTEIENIIYDQKINCQYAINSTFEKYADIFQKSENNYIKERSSDLKDVKKRILSNTNNLNKNFKKHIEEESIWVASDISPSEIIEMDKNSIVGVLTDLGGKTSHSVILLRSLGIPAIVALKNITKKIKNNDFVIVDGYKGKIIINPGIEVIEEYRKMKFLTDQKDQESNLLVGKKSVTKDNKFFLLTANISSVDEIDVVKKYDAEGIGLLRTEFLFINKKNPPSEEDQYLAYKTVLENNKDKSVVIRTLDAGGDKKVLFIEKKYEMNPFLGNRAIRLCFSEIEIFRTQLRALLRASIYGNLKIMFPMISSLEEVHRIKEEIELIKEKFDNENIAYAENMQIGIMIEVPSAAIISDVLAKEVDFFSIGTNDLIQFMTATDRNNEYVQHLFTYLNPAVLKTIKMVIDNGHKEKIPVSICGEMAGDLNLIPILLGMGVDELSMSPINILKARKIIINNNYKLFKTIFAEVSKMNTVDEIENYLESLKIS